MAFFDYINTYNSGAGLFDTESYLVSPNAGSNNIVVGNHEELRFLLQPLHQDSGVLLGGTNDILRTDWGMPQGSNAFTSPSADYCNRLNGTAEQFSGGIYSLQPNSPIGVASYTHSPTHINHGAKQHMILVNLSDDIHQDKVANYKFTLQGIFRSEVFEDDDYPTMGTHNAQVFVNTYCDQTILQGLPGWNPNPTGGSYYESELWASYTNSLYFSGNGGNSGIGLLDYYVDFVPLFNPINTNGLNPALDGFEWEDEKTGFVQFTFGSAVMRFDTNESKQLTNAIWNNITSSHPKFNSLTTAEKRARIFITYEPIQTGTHSCTNKYVRPHFDGTYNPQGNLGYNASYSSLKDAISDALTDVWAGTSDDFDSETQSLWNLIVEDTLNNKIQHIGNVNYGAYANSGGGNPNGYNGTPAINAVNGQLVKGSSNQILGGGLIRDVNAGTGSSAALLHGINLDTDYIPENTNTSTQWPAYTGLKLFPDGTTTYSGDNRANSYFLKNLSVQRYSNTTGNPHSSFGQIWEWHGAGSQTFFQLAVEDVDWLNVYGGGSGPMNRTNATYTGWVHDNQTFSWTCEIGNTLYDVQDAASYEGRSVIFHHQIIGIEKASIYDPNHINNSTTSYATEGPTALYYNLSGDCQTQPSLGISQTNPWACGGGIANNGVIELGDLAPFNLETCIITWVHPSLQTAVTYSAGGSNHTGVYNGFYGSTTGPTGAQGGKAEGLIDGTHTIGIQELGTGCTWTWTVTLTTSGASDPEIITTSANNPTCAGNDGYIDIWTVTGGISPYTYSWTGPSGYTSTMEDIQNLSAGIYTVIVTDQNGCTDSATFTLVSTATTMTVTSFTANDVSCYGSTDGGYILYLDGMSTGPSNTYTVGVTSDPAGSFSSTSTSYINSGTTSFWTTSVMAPGNYIWTVTEDSSGCSLTGTFTVGEPAAISLAYTILPGLCAGNNQVTLNPSGGTQPYSYAYQISGTGSWTPIASNILTGLADNDYDFQVTDASGCVTSIQNINVQANSSYDLDVEASINVTCNGLSDGEATFNFNDGTNTPTLNSTWTIDNYITTTSTIAGNTPTQANCMGIGAYCWNVDGLPAGTYDAVATNTSNGCSGSVTYTITEPSAITITETHSDVSCSGSNDGSITLTTSGGTAPYTFSWTKDGVSFVGTTGALTGLGEGEYIATITDNNGCTETITITILGDINEVVTIQQVFGPGCAGGGDGWINLTCFNGDFPFQIWFSTTSATTGFLQIQSATPGNSGSNQFFNSVDLGVGSPNIDDTWSYVSNSINLSLTSGLNFWIYLVSTTNSCQTSTVSGTIPVTVGTPIVLAATVIDSTCCNECGGSINLNINAPGGTTGGSQPYTYVWTSTAPISTTNPSPFITVGPNTYSSSIGGLCPGDYTIVITDDCGETATDTYTIAGNPVLITDLQYAHPFCEDCNCGSIVIVAEGGDGNPLVYSCNDGLHWVDTDPGSTANGPTIFNVTNYNASTVTPGIWTTVTAGWPVITSYGWDNLDDGIYRIWVRDHSPCSFPAFDDMIFDCNPGGPASCVNFCVDCTPNNCYADFVDVFADHSVDPWNGGTKIELENVSTLTVEMIEHSGPTIMGGSNGFIRFAVKEDFWWPNMRWFVEVFIMTPPTSNLTYDSNLLSGTYGDVCCDVPGPGACGIDCCTDIPNPMIIDAIMPTADPNLVLCGTTNCFPPVNITPWAFVLTDDNGIELCPNIQPNTGPPTYDSGGIYTYNVQQTQMGSYVEFELSNLSVTAALGAAAMEAMVVVRVTNNVSQAPPFSYSGISGCPIVAALQNCDDCTAAVLDNGMLNIINTFGAEDCDCNCPPGYILDERQYLEDPPGSGILIVNPDYNTCVGFSTTVAPRHGKCYDPNNQTIISGANDPVACADNSGVWKNNWNAVTVSQNMPCCANTLTWGNGGARLYGDFTSGTFASPVPIGQDISLLPYVFVPANPNESIVQDSGGGQLATDPSWSQNFSVYTTRLRDIGIWVEWFTQYTSNTDDHLPTGDFIGITVCTEELPQETPYILALAGDCDIEFLIDGVIHMKLEPQGGTYTAGQDMWNLFPIAIKAGTHTLEFRGRNPVGPAAFAFELYPFDVGGTPTASYLANPLITAIDLQNITVVDYAGNPISSEHHIGLDFHTTTTNLVGVQCGGGDYVTPCGGIFKCASSDTTDVECHNCEEDLEDLVGCVGTLVNPIYNKIMGGLLDTVAFHDVSKTAWSVLLIKYLIKRFAIGFRGTCITPEKLITWTRFLAQICPDCESNIKTIDEVDYLPDPNESSSPIEGIDGIDINTFDF